MEEDTKMEVEESTFWERMSFWVWGFLDDLIFRNKAVLSSRAYEVWTRLSTEHRGWDGRETQGVDSGPTGL